MASPAQITDELPETLHGDFVEWDEESPSAQPIQSGSASVLRAAPERCPAAATTTKFHEILLHSSRANAVEKTTPAKKKWPIIAGASGALVVILAGAMIPVFTRGRVPSGKPAAALAPTMTTIPQPEDAAPTRAHSALTVPASTAAATTASEAQISSKVAQRPVQKNARPSREQAQMMDDQLHAPTRLQMKATLAEQASLPPGGFSAAHIDGLDNSNAIGAVFGSPKQPREQIASQQATSPKEPREQIASQQAISVSSAIALGLLIQKRQPVYPLIAKTAQVSGTIVLAATISKTGNVESLRVMSGPAMLRDSAVDAVRRWRFKPYMLNNQPTPIETTINVHFLLN